MEIKVKKINFDRVTVEDSITGQTQELKRHDRVGKWTLMATIRSNDNRLIAVLEDHQDIKGSIVYIGKQGIILKLFKSLEPTSALEKACYRGHPLKEIAENPRDILAEEILAEEEDPSYEKVASCLPPIGKLERPKGVHQPVTFIGTNKCLDKQAIFYGGLTHSFNPIVYAPEIQKVIDEEKVWDGLVGGWLPVVRERFPIKKETAWEILIFADTELHTKWIQPVWYRLAKTEGGKLIEVHYFDSYLPYPPRMKEPKAEKFYTKILRVHESWGKELEGAMEVSVPEERIPDFCRHCLVREIITRIGDYPKYGTINRAYAGSEHDGFPDTFTSSTNCFLEWGLFARARRYIENYFSEFVREDGSIKYRGPEIGQYGRELTVLAQYYNYTKDHGLLLRHDKKIKATVDLLISLRKDGKKLLADDPAYGMIAGWSEADACLRPNPCIYNVPYFSNSTEAYRGFHDLGKVWVKIGQKVSQSALVDRGNQLLKEASELKKDIKKAIERSILKDTDPPYLPAIAGAKKSYDQELDEDADAPQIWAYRSYVEMLHSGVLSKEIVEMIVRYKARHGGSFLGIPGTTWWPWESTRTQSTMVKFFWGFIVYGHGYGLIQHDMIREFLLFYFAHMAHIHTRGTWTAFETNNMGKTKHNPSPYCLPAQLTIPALTKWMLVFEDPNSSTLWLAKGTPRPWLEDGKKISVKNSPTKWGKISYEIASEMTNRKIYATVELPKSGFDARINLRFRLPTGRQIRSVRVNGQDWKQFHPGEESVFLPSESKGRIAIEVTC